MTFKAFCPHPLIRGGRLQTIFGNMSKNSQQLMPDEEFQITPKIQLTINIPRISDIRTPIVLMVGSSSSEGSSSAMTRQASKILQEGVRTAQLCYDHREDWWKEGGTAPLKTSLELIYQAYPEAPIWLMGTSTSANIILNLLGQYPKSFPTLKCAMAVCPILDLEKASARCTQLPNVLWNRVSGGKLFRNLVVDKLPTPPTPQRALPNGKKNASLTQHIEVPTTIIVSEDDPLNDINAALKTPFSDAITLQVEKSGGHAGFISHQKTNYNDSFWLDHRFVEWVKSNGEAPQKIEEPEYQPLLV